MADRTTTMPPADPHTEAAPRLVGGLWCGEVLEGLADYLDGSMDPKARAQVDAHLADCDWCTRFGGRYAGTVEALQRGLGSDEPSDEVSERLLERLHRD